MKNPILIDLPMPIRTPRLLIRHPLAGDGAETNRAVLESFPELTQWMPWAEKIPSVEESELFVRQSVAKWHSREDLVFPIFDSKGTTQLGTTGLHRINWSIPSFEIGYWIRSSFAKQGFMTEAVNAVVRYAFIILSAKRIEIRCDATNINSLRVAERLGFHYDGKLKQNDKACHNQGLRDTLIYSRLNMDNLADLDVTWGNS